MPTPEAIVRALDFIEARLRAPLAVADIAGAVGYSLYHFCRVFGAAVRHSPYDYLMRRRMTLAAEEVLRTDRKIVDIALDYQFESHEGFTRAFQRMCGLAPREARRRGSVPAAARLPRLTGAHLACLARRNGLDPAMLSGIPELQADGPAQLACASGSASLPGRLGSRSLSPAGPLLPAAPFWLRAPLTWPESGFPGDGEAALPPGTCACFRLDPPLDDLPLVLDWVRHAWLFYAPYRQSSPTLAVLAAVPAGLPDAGAPGFTLVVPVVPREGDGSRR